MTSEIEMDEVTVDLDDLPEALAAAVREAAESGARTCIIASGTPIAALVPVDEAERLEDREDAYFAKAADEARARQGDRPGKSLAQVWAEIDAEEYGKAVA